MIGPVILLDLRMIWNVSSPSETKSAEGVTENDPVPELIATDPEDTIKSSDLFTVQ